VNAVPILLLWLVAAPLPTAATQTKAAVAERVRTPETTHARAWPWTCPWPWPWFVEGPRHARGHIVADDRAALRQLASTKTWPEVEPADAGIAAPQLEDRWFGEDKQRHFAMSFFVTSIGHAAGRMAGMDADAATLSGVVVAAAAGLGKEIHDRRGGGIFSVKDLVWDAAGIAVGAVLVRQAR
jgi:uncharacterized protein YfiM (DUF2279 family)